MPCECIYALYVKGLMPWLVPHAYCICQVDVVVVDVVVVNVALSVLLSCHLSMSC